MLNTLYLAVQGALGGLLSLITQGMLSVMEQLQGRRKTTGTLKKKKNYEKYIKKNKYPNYLRAALLTQDDIF